MRSITLKFIKSTESYPETLKKEGSYLWSLSTEQWYSELRVTGGPPSRHKTFTTSSGLGVEPTDHSVSGSELSRGLDNTTGGAARQRNSRTAQEEIAVLYWEKLSLAHRNVPKRARGSQPFTHLQTVFQRFAMDSSLTPQCHDPTN